MNSLAVSLAKRACVAPALGQAAPDLVTVPDVHSAIVDAAVSGDALRLRAAIAAHHEPIPSLIAAKAAS